MLSTIFGRSRERNLRVQDVINRAVSRGGGLKLSRLVDTPCHAMNRRIVEIDAEMARLRGELSKTQREIENLAEERGRALAAMEKDTAFIRKARGSASADQAAG